jgi:putative endonuclease
VFDQIEPAIHREKWLKRWPRAWKISLIDKENPNWSDLYPGIAGSP